MEYYCSNQVRKYLLQFLAVFGEMKVKIGATDKRPEALIDVSIHYGSKDKVSAMLFTENTHNKPLRLPTMSAFMTGLDLAPDLRSGVGQVQRDTYLPTGGVFPTDITTITRYVPIPYRATIDLTIYASNQDQHMQILEQILMYFDPILQIQTSDAYFDWTKITNIELVGIRFDENYPSGTEKRVIQTTLSFTMPIRISAPADLKQSFIKDIFLRISAASLDSNIPDEIIAELDSLGEPYTNISE